MGFVVRFPSNVLWIVTRYTLGAPAGQGPMPLPHDPDDQPEGFVRDWENEQTD